MIRIVCAALLLLASLAVATAAEATRISNPDGTTVDVVTNDAGSLVTSYNGAGKQTDKLRYPGYAGAEGHARLLKLLSPPGARLERQP